MVEHDNSLEDAINRLGTEVFAAIGRERPSVFSTGHVSSLMLDWCLKRPDFKVSMFRLVDVLPVLTTNSAVSRHITEYLSGPAATLHWLAKWGVGRSPDSVLGQMAAFTAKKSVEQMARIFIAGESPQEGLKALRSLLKQRLAFTVDLLGEFCLSEKEAERYMERYLEALTVFGAQVPRWPEAASGGSGPGRSTPVNLSIKLTALYSQCRAVSFEKNVDVLTRRLAAIAEKAAEVGAALCVDAEDAASNVTIYEVFKRVFGTAGLRDFRFPGIVVQAYARDSERVLRDLMAFAKERGSPITVRLVKGAYWDYETIIANQNNWEHPLYSRKEDSDAKYEMLSRLLLNNAEYCYPAFGSHNIRSLAHACCYAEQKGLTKDDFELQMLYGMAEPIAKAFSAQGFLTRLYVPIGALLPGMGYFVRRLLENTSNESFLKQSFSGAGRVEDLLREPRFGDADV